MSSKVPALPCATYTRKSSEEGLEQGFNSLDAQREACEAYILSQKTQGWVSMGAYDDGGFSGGNVERPGLQRLLGDVASGRVRIVVVYKVDRLTRSLADFAKMVELFDAHEVSFVSVTQAFNTTSSMGRLTLNVLLSFAQFEREVTGERIRDKIAASKRKGLWMGGVVPMGYVPSDRTLAINEPEAERVRQMYRLYLELGSVPAVAMELAGRGWRTPVRVTRRPGSSGGLAFSRGHVYRILSNRIYIGQIVHKDEVFEGQHPAIVDGALWDAVQELMRSNVNGHRTRVGAAEPSLLTGLVFDEWGHRLTPTHAKKGSVRYRYYIDQTEPVVGDGVDGEARLRLPAQELESAVIDAVAEFLKDRSRLMEVMERLEGTADANVARARLLGAGTIGARLEATAASQRIEMLQRLVDRVVVRGESVDIAVRVGAIWEVDGPSGEAGEDEDAPVFVIEVPVQLKRCGMAVRLVVRPAGSTIDPVVDAGLVTLIGKALDWFERLRSGRADSALAIAEQDQVRSAHVTGVMGLAYLAPDIVHRLVRGDHPRELTVGRLMKMLPLPLDWEAQRVVLKMIG
jgi:DNA invertase Pin-like site-specific DNA recombinase